MQKVGYCLRKCKTLGKSAVFVLLLISTRADLKLFPGTLLSRFCPVCSLILIFCVNVIVLFTVSYLSTPTRAPVEKTPLRGILGRGSGCAASFLEYWLNFFNCSSLFVTRAPVEKTHLRCILGG